MRTIILDNGHGGAIGNRYQTEYKRSQMHQNGIRFHEGVWNRYVVDKFIKNYASQYDGQIIKLVPEQHDIGLAERVTRANLLHKKYPDAFLISVHANAAVNHRTKKIDPRPDGYETYTCRTPPEKTLRLAEGFHYEIVQSGLFYNRGLKRADFYILKRTTMQAILLELGFYTNFAECIRMSNPKFVDNITKAIFNGILKVNKLTEQNL